MKKILFISNISNNITNFSIPSIEAAQAQGYDFHMAANYSGFKNSSTCYKVTLHHIDLIRNPLSIKNIKAYRQMNNLIRAEKFDVIHCNTPIGGILGRICGKKNKVPKIIYTAHGFHFYKGASILNQVLHKNIEKWLAHFTDSIVTINNEDYEAAKTFKRRNDGNVYYIPGVGVNTKEYQITDLNKEDLKGSLGLKKNSIIFVAMGDLILRKNYKTSIEAISKAANPEVYLLICGTGPELANLKEFAKLQGVEKQIIFLGYRNDIKEILNISDVFLFTTLQEGLPRSMMEAMSAGLPCIASKIRGNIDLIENGKGGYLVDSKDSVGFSEAIKILTKDIALREKMGRLNLLNVKKFDVENIKLEMKKIYSKELV